jgi:hypothetical protein
MGSRKGETIMGYTHYFPQVNKCEDRDWRSIRLGMLEVLNSKGIPPLAGGLAEEDSVPDITDDRIWFNGVGKDSHETMAVYRDKLGSNFCKTSRKPYDVVVVALLCIMNHVAPYSWDIGSDGDKHEWEDGLALARSATGWNIKMLGFFGEGE